MAELVIDPQLDLPYYTFVIRGIRAGGYAQRIRFSKLDAPSDRGAAMVLRSGSYELRIFADTNDHAIFEPDVLRWADRYAKTNLGSVPSDPRVVLLGPTFGITEWSLPFGYSVATRMACAGARPRRAVSGIRFQAIARRPIDAYVPAPSDPGYVFHASRAWSGRHRTVNDPRHRFFAVSSELGINIDGGFLDERLSLDDYIARTQRSALVFNCPAVHGCLGWKLGEYLALGKAIISTPLDRVLPAPLVHEEHVHYVNDDEASIGAAVELLLSSADYRRHLENGSRHWYDRYLRPDAMATRLIEGAPDN